MAKKGYKYTDIYAIPYLRNGVTMSEKEEETRARIIENQLFAGSCGVATALFEDGSYSVFDNGDDTFCVTINPIDVYSVMGIVNHRLFRSNDVVVFDGLEKNEIYYLYAAYQSELNVDPSKFRRVATRYKKELEKNSGYVLLATVDLSGDKSTIDKNPEGKLYSRDSVLHTTDITNPHGTILHQDTLVIHKELKFGDEPVYLQDYRTIYADGQFAGDGNPTKMSFDSEVMFASIMPLNFGYGEYWCEIKGKELLVYNSGTHGGYFKAEVRIK